jgi:hypothetical protein
MWSRRSFRVFATGYGGGESSMIERPCKVIIPRQSDRKPIMAAQMMWDERKEVIDICNTDGLAENAATFWPENGIWVSALDDRILGIFTNKGPHS